MGRREPRIISGVRLKISLSLLYPPPSLTQGTSPNESSRDSAELGEKVKALGSTTKVENIERNIGRDRVLAVSHCHRSPPWIGT